MKVQQPKYEINDLVVICDPDNNIVLPERMLTISKISIEIKKENEQEITYCFRESLYRYYERAILKKVDFK